MPPARNPRKLVPPREKALRRKYFALMGRARKATSQAQKLYLLGRARALMVRVEVECSAGGVVLPPQPPPAADHRPRPRRRVKSAGERGSAESVAQRGEGQDGL